MPLWGKVKETVTDDPAGNRAFKSWTKTERRNVIATKDGWVKRDIVGTRIKDEILVSGNFIGPSGNNLGYLGTPDIAEVFVSSNSTGGTALTKNTFANVYVVFNEPMKFSGLAGKLKITIANTAGGNNCKATSNNTNGSTSVIIANNTIVFKVKLPNSVGTYKIQAQTIANVSATASNLVTYNTGARSANLVITGVVSNACGTFTAK